MLWNRVGGGRVGLVAEKGLARERDRLLSEPKQKEVERGCWRYSGVSHVVTGRGCFVMYLTNI